MFIVNKREKEKKKFMLVNNRSPAELFLLNHPIKTKWQQKADDC